MSSLTLALIPTARLAGSHAQERRSLTFVRDGAGARRHRWLVISRIRETIINVLVLSPFFVLGPVIAQNHLGGAPAWSAIALGYVIGNLAAANITYHWAPKRPVLAALTISSATRADARVDR